MAAFIAAAATRLGARARTPFPHSRRRHFCATWSLRDDDNDRARPGSARPHRAPRARNEPRRYETRRNEPRRYETRRNVAPKPAEQDDSLVRQVRDSGDDVLYGVNPVLNAVYAGRRDIRHVLLQRASEASTRKRDNAAALHRIRKGATALGATITEVDKGVLNVLVGHRKHQGVVAQASALDYLPERELRVSNGVLLALDGVSDPQNVGAVLRSAHFLGAAGVVVSARNCAPLGAATSKASAGAAEAVAAFETPSLPRLLRRLREDGWRVVALAADGGRTLREVGPAPRTVLVVGGEGEGLRALVRRECDEVVAIDGGCSEVDSLNVSVAAAIALHHLLR